MAFKDLKLEMHNIMGMVKDAEELQEHSNQLVKAAEDLLKYKDADMEINITIRIDTNHTIEEKESYKEMDEIDRFLEKMKDKGKNKDNNKTIQHNVDLFNLSHELGLSIIEHLNNKAKVKIESLEKKIKEELYEKDSSK